MCSYVLGKRAAEETLSRGELTGRDRGFCFEEEYVERKCITHTRNALALVA